MKAKETKPTTLQYRATTSEAGYRRIQDALLQMGHLRNALIRHRESARSSHRHAFSFKLQNAHLTDLHRNDPDFNSYTRRLLASVAQNVNKSYNTYFKHPDAGRPRTASPFRNRTIEVSEPATQHLKAKKNGWATIQIKGLPVIKFRTDKRLPENEQPMVIRITLKPRRLDVSLTYQSEPKGIGKPTKESVGIDPGVKQSRNYSEVPARQHQPGRVVGKNNGPRWNFQAPTKPDSPGKSRGETRVQGSKGNGRGFPEWMVPSAKDGDGDGDGVVCER